MMVSRKITDLKNHGFEEKLYKLKWSKDVRADGGGEERKQIAM